MAPVNVCRVVCQSRQANNEGVRVSSVWDFFFFFEALLTDKVCVQYDRKNRAKHRSESGSESQGQGLYCLGWETWSFVA